jgi:hypothetical protein
MARRRRGALLKSGMAWQAKSGVPASGFGGPNGEAFFVIPEKNGTKNTYF